MTDREENLHVPKQSALKHENEYPNKVWLWLMLMVFGFVFEYACRFFGYRENPSGIWHESTPLLGVVIAAFVILAGFFRIYSAWDNAHVARFRTGAQLLLLGAAMLAASFVFHSIMPLLYG